MLRDVTIWVTVLNNEKYNSTHYHILPSSIYKISEAVGQRCSTKKVFLEISENSQENTCSRVSFLIKLQACNYF